MKKLIALLLAVVLVFSLTACGKKKQTEPQSVSANKKIAFITDSESDLKDHSFNQSSYQGVTRFCESNSLKYKYYTAKELTDQGRRAAIDRAIADGYDVIVMAGYVVAPILADAAKANPDVLFLVLDVPVKDLGVKTCPKNLALLCYREEQAGYLAGYAAVKGGYTELGFLGGDAVPAVVRYGYGFVQGADAAAAELKLDDVHINYWYSGSFNTNNEITIKVDNWFVSGTEVIFVCGGGIYQDCLATAEADEGKFIGVDVDQSADSECIITSAMKSLSDSVQTALQAAADNAWVWPKAYAGTCQWLGAAEGGIGLPMESTCIEGFTQEDYDALYAALADGSVVVDDNCDTAVHPKTKHVTVVWEQEG